MNKEKIGLYTVDEIYERLTENIEGSFLNRSMVDTMIFTIEDLQNQLKEKDKVIVEANDKMEELLYLASKCSTIYKNNIETVGIYDRLKELSEILESGKNEK